MLTNFKKELESFDGLETNYVKILYYDLPKNYSGSYKTYSYSRFCTILDGEKHVTLNNNKNFTYRNNDYLLLPPRATVNMDITKHTKALVFELNDELVDNVMKKIDLKDDVKESIKCTNDYFLGHNKFNILGDVSNILNAANSKDKNNNFLIDLYSQKLVYELIQNKASYHILNFNHSHPISIAVKYINHNLDQTINIQSLAKKLSLSESNFTHLFKKFIGITPVEYIKTKKLEAALIDLKTESVTDVAFNLGYSNISYFIKLFKSKYNMTPKQYKLKNFQQCS